MGQQSALDGAEARAESEVQGDGRDHLAQALGVSTVVKDAVTLTKAEQELRAQALDIEDLQQFQHLYNAENGVALVKPTYNPVQLEQLTHTNNTLGVCISAMETNIDGTGWKLVDEDGDAEKAKGIQGYADVTSLLAEPWPGISFTTLRRRLRRDQESCGYWALEIIRDGEGVLRFLRRADAKLIRLVTLDEPVPVTKTIMRGTREVQVTMFMRERRYAMAVGSKVTYFKEYGCTRELNAKTGLWLEDKEVKRANEPGSGIVLANELMVHGVIPDTKTNYHVPRWVSQIPSILGSRKAEEFNLEFFDHGGIPPAFIFIEGGQLTGRSRTDLTDYLSGKAKFKQRAVLCELFSSSGDLNSAGNVKVNVQRFGAENQKDSMFENYDSKCSERVRTGFRLPPLFLGKAQDFNFACYDEQTEALTDQGWKLWSEYRPGMRVAQVHPDTGAMEFVLPSALHTYDVEDVEMHAFSGRGMDLMVTPRHRMLYRTEHSDWKVQPIEEMPTNVKFRTSVEWDSGEELDVFDVPAHPVSVGPTARKQYPVSIPGDDFLSLLGWVVSDGGVTPSSEVQITQHEDRHLSEIQEWVNRIPVPHVVRGEGPVKYVRLKDSSLHGWMRENVGKAETKCLPDWALGLSKRQLQILFSALVCGDGTADSRKGRTSMAYSTSSSKLADQVQEIALKLGYRANIREDRPGTYGRPLLHRVLMSDRGAYRVRAENRSRVLYTGKVWCFSVPSGVFVTRRNGCVAMQGNTAKASYMVAEAQVFAPERDEFDEIINLSVMKELAPGLKLRSLPLSVTDVENQIKVLGLSQGVATKDSRLDAMNEVSGLSLALDESGEENQDAVKEAVNRLLGEPKPDPDNPTGGNGEEDDEGVPDGGDTTIEASENGRIRKMDGWLLTELANDWSGYLSGYKDFTDDEVGAMRGIIRTMTPEVRNLFSNYVGTRMVKDPSDLAGTSALLTRAGECLDHDHT